MGQIPGLGNLRGPSHLIFPFLRLWPQPPLPGSLATLLARRGDRGMPSWTLHRTLRVWKGGGGGVRGVAVRSLSFAVGWEGRDLSGALACCWPHPGGTIFTHLNSPSQEALGSSLVTDLGLVPLAGCSGHSLGVRPTRDTYREGAFFAPGQELYPTRPSFQYTFGDQKAKTC